MLQCGAILLQITQPANRLEILLPLLVTRFLIRSEVFGILSAGFVQEKNLPVLRSGLTFKKSTFVKLVITVTLWSNSLKIFIYEVLPEHIHNETVHIGRDSVPIDSVQSRTVGRCIFFYDTQDK